MKPNHPGPNFRVRPSVLALLAVSCFAVSAVLWLTTPKRPGPGTHPEASSRQTAVGDVAVAPSEANQNGAAVAGPALASNRALAVDKGQPIPGAASEPPDSATTRSVAPVSVEEEAKVYETAAHALQILANPELSEPSMLTVHPQGDAGAQVAESITNGVLAYREKDRLKRQRVQEMRALRNATIVEARRNQTNNP